MLQSDVNDNAAKVLPMSAIMNRLKVDSALHKVRPCRCTRARSCRPRAFQRGLACFEGREGCLWWRGGGDVR